MKRMMFLKTRGGISPSQLAWLVLVALGFCAVTNMASAALLDGVISAWTFNDGTGNDLFNRNNGKFMDGAYVMDAPTANKISGHLMMDADKNAYCEAPHGPSMDAMKDAFTVAAWAFIGKSGDHAAIVYKGAAIGWGPNYLFRIATTNDSSLTWGACNQSTEGWFETADVYKAGEWFHVALTADGKNVTAYVNGEIVKATNGDATGGATRNPKPIPGPYLTFPDQPIRMAIGIGRGGDLNNKDYLRSAMIDEVVMFRRALSQSEIKELMNLDISTAVGTTAVTPKSKLAVTWGSLKHNP